MCLFAIEEKRHGSPNPSVAVFLACGGLTSLLLAAATCTVTAVAATVTYDTAPYWPRVSAIARGMGPDQASTIAQTFLAPAGDIVILNDFSFNAESYYPPNGVSSLYLRAFVYSWAGSLTGRGGGAAGSPLYLGPSYLFTPPPRPGGWVPLTAQIGGGGLRLDSGHQYVMGFTISDPGDYAASQGDVEFQTVPVRNPNYPPLVPRGVDFGNGGAVWLNNGNDFAALNSIVWSTWGDIGVMAFTAHFTVTDDITPPAISIATSSKILWPPNGAMVPVTVTGRITDEPDGSGVNPSTAAYAVTDDYGKVEPSGPIQLQPDGTYAFVILLQASRRPTDMEGRQYTVTVTAQDRAGNTGSASTYVTVPHDRGGSRRLYLY